MKATKIGPFGMGIVYDYDTIIKTDSKQSENFKEKGKKLKKNLYYKNDMIKRNQNR